MVSFKVILTMDGYRGHLGVNISKKCLEKGVKLWLYPPNTTHVLQPLDQVFGPVKQRIKILSHNWHGNTENINAGRTLDQYTKMSAVAYKAFEDTFKNPEVIKQAWRKTGFIPFEKRNIDMEKLNPSKMYVSSLNTDGNNGNNNNNSSNNDTNMQHNNHNNSMQHNTNIQQNNTIMQQNNTIEHTNHNIMQSNNMQHNNHQNSMTQNNNNMHNNHNNMLNNLDNNIQQNNNDFNIHNNIQHNNSSEAMSRVMAIHQKLTQKEKSQRLAMHEIMHRDQVPLFEALFQSQEYEVPSLDYQIWLLLKRQALGTEIEAISRVCQAQIPQGIQKSKRKRACNLPPGADRYVGVPFKFPFEFPLKSPLKLPLKLPL